MKKEIKENWEKELLRATNLNCPDDTRLWLLSFISAQIKNARAETLKEVLKLIDADYKGRDITIYELGQEIIKRWGIKL